MTKSIILKLSVFLFGCILAFIVGEIVLRQLGYAASDIYTQGKSGLLVLNPDRKIHVRSDCFQNDVKTNSLGFHSKEYPPDKPNDIFRIAIVGDSFVEAVQVPLENNVSTLLEQKLNSIDGRQFKYEVIPFGISSHGTYKNILYYENYVADFNPDLVINALAWNDVEDDAYEQGINFNEEDQLIQENDLVESLPTTVKQVKKILRKSALITMLRKKYLETKTKSEKPKKSAQVAILNPEYDDFWRNAWDLQGKLLRDFKYKVIKNNSKFLLISLTDGYRVHPDLEQEFKVNFTSENIDSEKPEKVLSNIAGINKIDYLPLNPAFRQRAQSGNDITVWPCDGHWNEVGHQWAAEEIYEFLIYENLLPNK